MLPLLLLLRARVHMCRTLKYVGVARADARRGGEYARASATPPPRAPHWRRASPPASLAAATRAQPPRAPLNTTSLLPRRLTRTRNARRGSLVHAHARERQQFVAGGEEGTILSVVSVERCTDMCEGGFC